MFFHASPVGGLTTLTPHVSNHGKALVYCSGKRENVLVYLSNAVEKHCRETGFAWNGPWYKWASYGFSRDGILLLEEYYPNATQEVYGGVSGFIYHVADTNRLSPLEGIRDAFVSDQPIPIAACERIPDAYEAILEAESKQQLVIRRYEELTAKNHQWLENAIRQDYANAEPHPEYRYFLKSKFPFLSSQV